MSEIIKKPVKITETVLRDAHQSLIATRMRTEEMLPILEKLDKVGYDFYAGSIYCSRFLFTFGGEWLLAKKTCVSTMRFGHGKCALLPMTANSWV